MSKSLKIAPRSSPLCLYFDNFRNGIIVEYSQLVQKKFTEKLIFHFLKNFNSTVPQFYMLYNIGTYFLRKSKQQTELKLPDEELFPLKKSNETFANKELRQRLFATDFLLKKNIIFEQKIVLHHIFKMHCFIYIFFLSNSGETVDSRKRIMQLIKI